MPLFTSARDRIRVNLQSLNVGRRPRPVVIGNLSEVQLAAINHQRMAEELPAIIDEIVFVGKHVHNSRMVRDGYTIDDVVAQIMSACSSDAVVIEYQKMTAMENPIPRDDGYGNAVLDRVVFECMGRHPRPELHSVIPKGDDIKPINAKEAIPVDSLSQNSNGSPG